MKQRKDQENTLVIANTLFQQPNRRFYTWASPDGQYQNQIDYILCSQRWRNSIQSAKTRPGGDYGSDCELLIAKFRLKLNTARPFRSEKAMAPHSSTLAWKIPWTEEPGRLQSMRSLRAGHDWASSLSLFTFMHWSRKWQPTPVFLPGESQGRGLLVGCRLWGRTESDMTEAT